MKKTLAGTWNSYVCQPHIYNSVSTSRKHEAIYTPVQTLPKPYLLPPKNMTEQDDATMTFAPPPSLPAPPQPLFHPPPPQQHMHTPPPPPSKCNPPHPNTQDPYPPWHPRTPRQYTRLELHSLYRLQQSPAALPRHVCPTAGPQRPSALTGRPLPPLPGVGVSVSSGGTSTSGSSYTGSSVWGGGEVVSYVCFLVGR